MATAVNAGEVKRSDFLLVDPRKIIISEDLRGRTGPVSPEKLINFAVSFIENGQRVPAEAHRLMPDKTLELHMGFTRHEAAMLVVNGFTGPDGKKYRDPNFKFKVIINDVNRDEAFKLNIVENAHRNQTSPIDDAHNHHALRDKHGMNDVQIAHLYQYPDASKVSRLRKLLTLSNKIQKMIHAGDITMAAALDLTDLPADKQEQAVKDAMEGGTFDNKKVRKAAREHHLANHEGGETPTGKTKVKAVGRSLGELKEFFKWHIESTKSPESKAFAETVLEYVAGKKSDQAMTKFLDKTFTK